MIRILLMLVIPLALPYLVWKAWRLFGPAEEIREAPPPAGQTGAEVPFFALAVTGVVLVAITLTYLILTGDGDITR
ncbi:MAG: hypothetical protein V3R85_07275 [Alphaproteobacteria bacterium]